MDKRQWPAGEWKDEPDEVVWGCPEAELLCAIGRNDIGALCGYVAVKDSHPLYGKPHSDTDLHAHCGLNYGSSKRPDTISHGAGVPEENVWWFGFHCSHVNDISPANGKTHWPPSSEYRNLIYVFNELEKLADQLTA